MASQQDLPMMDIYNQLQAQSELKSLVTTREMITESFLKEIIDTLPVPANSSAVELAKAWKDEARKRIAGLSVTLSHRVQPIVQLMLEQKLATSMDKAFLTIQTVEAPIFDMVEKYRRCFNTWVDASSCVSFKTTNVCLLGNLSVKDMFLLTYFAFLTCKRVKNDNILQLGIVGCTTTGKSTIFEAPLMEGSHVTTNENGVGRFHVGSKTVLLFHDIAIRTLAASRDTEKIKTIARTEPTVTKIHSTTYALPALFLFYSSNERLLNHKFEDAPIQKSSYYSRLFPSQVHEVGRKRALSDESLMAIQNRFIEAFVRAPPSLAKQDLPQSGGFNRLHAVFGLFCRVIEIMQKYKPDDFYSPVLIHYVLHGLCANNKEHTDTMQTDVSILLKGLVIKYAMQSSELKSNLLTLIKGPDDDQSPVSFQHH